MSLFIKGKHSEWYFGIIQKAKVQDRKKSIECYYENHHIVPKSLGGGNSKENLVLLTAREHFVCHLLLTKMTLGRSRSKMICAFWRFKNKGHNKSHLYELFKINLRKLSSGNNNPFFGRKHTQENIEIMKDKKRGTNNPMFGKKHTDDSKSKISKTKKDLRQRCKKCTDGIHIFDSLTDMAAAYKLSIPTMLWRIKSRRFKQFNYCGGNTSSLQFWSSAR